MSSWLELKDKQTSSCVSKIWLDYWSSKLYGDPTERKIARNTDLLKKKYKKWDEESSKKTARETIITQKIGWWENCFGIFLSYGQIVFWLVSKKILLMQLKYSKKKLISFKEHLQIERLKFSDKKKVHKYCNFSADGLILRFFKSQKPIIL